MREPQRHDRTSARSRRSEDRNPVMEAASRISRVTALTTSAAASVVAVLVLLAVLVAVVFI